MGTVSSQRQGKVMNPVQVYLGAAGDGASCKKIKTQPMAWIQIPSRRRERRQSYYEHRRGPLKRQHRSKVHAGNRARRRPERGKPTTLLRQGLAACGQKV